MANYIQLDDFQNQEQAAIPLEINNGLKAYITLGKAGDMSFQKRDIIPDRWNYFKRVKIDPAQIYSVYQEHTKKVIAINAQIHPDHYAATRADGLITISKAVFLAITVADCLPLFIYDTQNGAFGLVHSGWKGTGIVLEAVTAIIKEYGSNPRNLKIVIGPGIGACCYDVPHNRYRGFLADYGPDCAVKTGEKYFLDLKKTNISLLESYGINDITVINHCTVCCRDFHSYRREGAGAYGLMLAYIGYSHF